MDSENSKKPFTIESKLLREAFKVWERAFQAKLAKGYDLSAAAFAADMAEKRWLRKQREHESGMGT